ncbi:hypothetical protein EIMP302_49630 [Escherichia coli]|jgi:hypothetical protein|nr:hypothetical protein EIMP302_49630 [Escherichia coli]
MMFLTTRETNMSKKVITIQVRGGHAGAKPVRRSKLEQSVNRSLRASFSLEGNHITNTSWSKMSQAARFLTRVAVA